MAKKYKRNTEPTFTLSELEQYGFGDWLKKNAGWLAPVGAVVGTALTGGLAAPALASAAAGAGAAGSAAAGAGAALAGGAGALAGTTAATAGLTAGATSAGLGLGTIGAGLGAASKVGGAIADKANQADAMEEQQQAMQQQATMQNNAQLTNRLQKNQFQNIPTFMCGGRLKKYDDGGDLPEVSTKDVVVDVTQAPYYSNFQDSLKQINEEYNIPTEQVLRDKAELYY